MKVLGQQQMAGLLKYEPGNILMVHIDTGKTTDKMEKRRVFFDRLGEFIRYDHGNVVVRLDVGVRISSGSAPRYVVTIPIYHTKFVAKNRDSVPSNIQDYYVKDAYVQEPDSNS
jgi:hypothetical protein